MARRKRMWVIFFSGLAVAAIILLSAGISGLELLPGRPFTLGEHAQNAFSGIGSESASPLEGFLRAVWSLAAIVCLVLLPISIVYFIISPKARKRILRDILSLAAFLIVYSILLVRRAQLAGASEAQASAAPATDLTPVEFAPPSEGLVFWVSVGLAAAVIAGGWFVWRRLRPKPSPLQQLAQEAQAAIEELRAGGDWKNAVIRCYFEMSRALNDWQGIRRQRDMTPREFEKRLEQTGLPAEHIQRLTRLFEEARYSPKSPTEREEREAIACLTAIVQACGQPS